MSAQTSKEALATIAAMRKRRRPILLALILTISAALYGCGSSGPDPSIPKDDSQVLLAKIAEIKANVDVGSCLVAADKTDDLLADIASLPSSVNNDVKQALDNGANSLKLMLTDPSKCQGRSATTTTESTTAPTTTEETTTERTQPTTTERTQTQPTTTTQPPQTQTETTPGASGGIGPGGL